MPEEEIRTLEASLAEFAALRAEILHTMTMQWNIVAFQLAATSVIFSFSLSSSSRVGFLLILPAVTYALASRYLGNYYGMQRLGYYIRTQLSPKIPGGLQWEEWHRKNHPSYKGLLGWAIPFRLLNPLPLIFPGVSTVSLIWGISFIIFNQSISTWSRILLGIIWIIDLAITIISFYSIKRADNEEQSTIIPGSNGASINDELGSRQHKGTADGLP